MLARVTCFPCSAKHLNSVTPFTETNVCLRVCQTNPETRPRVLGGIRWFELISLVYTNRTYAVCEQNVMHGRQIAWKPAPVAILYCSTR